MKRIELRFNAGVEYKGNIYASAVYINGLFRINLHTYEIEYIKIFSKEKPCFAIHRMAFLYNNEAWFIPQNGQYIAVVDLDTLAIEYLKPPFRKINTEAVSKIDAMYYSGGIIGEKYLYLIPTNIDTLLVIDLEKKEMYPYYEVPYAKEYYLYGAYANECIYLAPYTGKDLLVINLRTNVRKRYRWKYIPIKHTDIVSCENRIWFSPYTSDKILCLNLQEKRIELIPLGRLYDEKCTYDQIVLYEKKLFFIPFQANKILKLNLDNNSLTKIDIKPELLENEVNGFCRIFSKDKIILASYSKSVIIVYDKDCDDFYSIKLEIERSNLIKTIEKDISFQYKNFICIDQFERILGLKKYVRLFGDKDVPEYISENIGNNIWTKLKGI